MQPEPVEAQPEETPRSAAAEKERRQTKHVLGDAVEQFGLQDADAGVNERRDMPRLARREPAFAGHREIARPVDADGAGARGDEQHRVHRSGSNASASRSRFERGPSIQNASVLQTKNGSRPISGSAFLMPPP